MLPSIDKKRMAHSSSAPNVRSAIDLVGSEISMTNIHRKATQHTVPTRSWLTNKSYENHQKNFMTQLNDKKQRYANEALESVYERYVRQREEVDHKADDAKWHHIFRFVDLVETKLQRPIPLVGFEKALYESMFKHEPRKLISQPRFLTVMREVYGFEIANTNSICDNSTLRKLVSLFKSYTSSRDAEPGGLEWRVFIFMIHIVQEPLKFGYDHLNWGFKLYSSQGFFDPEASTRVTLRDVCDIFCAASRYEWKKEVREAVNEAWLQIANIDNEAGRLASQAETSGRTQQTVQMTYRMFKLMLEQPSLAPLLEPDMAFGERDLETWTILYEEQFYHPLLLQYVKNKRRIDRNERRCKEFRQRWGRQTKKNRFKDWQMFVYRRKRSRGLMVEAQERYTNLNATEAFGRLKNHAMRSVAAEHLQRYYRGHWAKMERWFLLRVDFLVVKIQSKFRMFKQRKIYRRLLMRMNWAATEVQRHARGNIARRYFAKIILNYYDAEMKKIQEEKVAYRTKLEEKAALLVQTNWRAKLARQRAILKAEKEYNDAMVLTEMRQVENEAERLRRIHMAYIEKWYKEKKAEHDKYTIDEQSTADAKFKLVQYQLAEKFKAEEKRRKQKADNVDREEQFKVERWYEEWEAKAEKRAQEVISRLNTILDDPLTNEEIQQNKEWKKRIKKRSKAVIKQADRDKVEMEWIPARTEARRQLVEEAAEEERKKVRIEMKKAAEIAVRDKGLADLEGEWQWFEQIELHLDKAAAKVQAQARRWLARRALRVRAQQVYVKAFDTESGNYFYTNSKTGASFWEKPKSLGFFDVKAKDEWLVMKTKAADKDLFYYYNPHTMLMSWEKPEGTILCGICETEFASCYCNVSKIFYCNAHYEEQHAHWDIRDMSWKNIVGNISSAEGVDLQSLKNHCDPSVAQETLPAPTSARARHRDAIAESNLLYPNNSSEETMVRRQTIGNIDPQVICSMCREVQANRLCHQCQVRYCVDCFMDAHGKGPWKKHTFNNI